MVKKKEPPDLPWAHSPSYSISLGGSSPGVFGGRGAELIIHLHLVPELRMNGARDPLTTVFMA